MYFNRMGLRAYPRVKKKSSHHYNKLARKVGELLPNSYSPEVTPEVEELDQLEAFVVDILPSLKAPGFLSSLSSSGG